MAGFESLCQCTGHSSDRRHSHLCCHGQQRCLDQPGRVLSWMINSTPPWSPGCRRTISAGPASCGATHSIAGTEMKATGYRWWLARMGATLRLYDIVRVDHFRGFAGYWEIPAAEEYSDQRRMGGGPESAFFDVMVQKLGDDLPIIAEDLGEITPDVIDGDIWWGMKILQFAFRPMQRQFCPTTTRALHRLQWDHDNDTSVAGTDGHRQRCVPPLSPHRSTWESHRRFFPSGLRPWLPLQ